MTPLTYGDLPERDRTATELPNSAIAYGNPVILYRPSCGIDYSATRGDYYALPDSKEIVCFDCNEPMILARKHITIEEVEPERLES